MPTILDGLLVYLRYAIYLNPTFGRTVNRDSWSMRDHFD